MTLINMVLVCDGTSDAGLVNIAQWVTDTEFPNLTFRMIAAREVIPAHGALSDRLQRAFEAYAPDIIICHRDAEAMSLEDRSAQIDAARLTANLAVPVVAAVPVRMIENWLLMDEKAIRCAADNRNGTIQLNLPRHSVIESLTDAKDTLFVALRTASNLPTQRLRGFNHHRARSRVTEFIDDFSPLRNLPSFRAFETQLIAAVVTYRLNH